MVWCVPSGTCLWEGALAEALWLHYVDVGASHPMNWSWAAEVWSSGEEKEASKLACIFRLLHRCWGEEKQLHGGFFSRLGGGGEWGDVILLWSGCCGRERKAAADGIVFVAASEWQTLTTKILPCPLRSLGSCNSPCQRSAMSPGCMLLLVFGFVGGAVVINSAILVSLSVLLLVHFSISTGVPALTQNLPRILRYPELRSLLSFLLYSLFSASHYFSSLGRGGRKERVGRC